MITRKDIMYQHMIAFQGIDGKINDKDYRFLVAEESDGSENNYDLKYIITDQPIKQGDYVTIDDSIFMIIDTKQVINSKYTKGVFREVLKITLQATLKDVYAVVDRVRNVFEQGSEITEVHDQYQFIVPKSSCNYTSISAEKNLIIYAGGSYDAISIDDSKEGILTVTGRFNTVYIPHTYGITLNSSAETLVETGTYTIIPTCTDNNIADENPKVIYMSSDETIATVTSDGVVTALKEGNCVITATYMNVSAKLTLTINAKTVEPVVSYTYNFSQSITAFRTYVTNTLTTFKTVDGVADPNLKINYIFDSAGQGLISSGKVVVTVASDSSIKIKNASVSSKTTIHLTVTDSANDYVIVDKDIILIGI